jgi:hypothetical protein
VIRRRIGLQNLRARSVASALALLAIMTALILQHHALSASLLRERTINQQADGEPAWIAEVRRVDAALGHGDIDAAERAWRDAHLEAVRTRGWKPMIEVGDAAVRIGEASGNRDPVAPQARQAYLSAFFRARGLHARDGMLRASDAFAAIGDREIAERFRRAAEQ